MGLELNGREGREAEWSKQPWGAALKWLELVWTSKQIAVVCRQYNFFWNIDFWFHASQLGSKESKPTWDLSFHELLLSFTGSGASGKRIAIQDTGGIQGWVLTSEYQAPKGSTWKTWQTWQPRECFWGQCGVLQWRSFGADYWEGSFALADLADDSKNIYSCRNCMVQPVRRGVDWQLEGAGNCWKRRFAWWRCWRCFVVLNESEL